MTPKKIGVFDSGVGGISVLKSLIDSDSFEEIIYYGDTARVPYGVRSKETIIQYSLEALEFFKQFNLDLLVVACNKDGVLPASPVKHYVAAISAGIVDDVPMLDLCYEEDSSAMVDLNCVMNEEGALVELQGTGEGRAFTLAEQQQLVALCQKGIGELIQRQKEILEGLK